MKLSIAAAALTLALTSTASSALPAFQSGSSEGALYAAGIVSNGDELYVTGSTYDGDDDSTDFSQCLVAKLGDTLSSGWTQIQYYSTASSNVDTACRALAVLSDTQLVVVGTSDAGGLFGEDIAEVQAGFGMTVGRDDLALITGSSLFTETQVPYPQAVVVDPDDPDTLFVASMTSQDTTLNTPQSGSTSFPNWSKDYKHGQNFEMTIEKLSYTSKGAGSTFDGILDVPTGGTASPPELTRVWAKNFPVNKDGGSPKSVYVGGMIWKPNVGLIVAGSTAALGVGYGPAEGDDEDGYVTILDPSTGELSASRTRNNQRFGTSEYDIVTGICDDPNDAQAFYVVGATRGDMIDDDTTNNGSTPIAEGSLQAFIKKVNADTLYGFWTVQEGAFDSQLPDKSTQTTAWGCAVRDNFVYVTGIVQDGAGMVEKGTGATNYEDNVHKSSGQDDIWMAQYDTSSGELNWMQQVGSSGNDHVARNNPIAIDAKGNAVLFGDTDGPLYRDRTLYPDTDLFVMTFTQADGSYEMTIEGDVLDDKEMIMDTEGAIAPPNDDDDEVGYLGQDDVEDLPTDSAVSSSAQVHQSGPNAGAMFASGVIYDSSSDQAIITGISYTDSQGGLSPEPNCLVARIEIGSMETKRYNIMGNDGVLEACRGVGIKNDSNDIMSSTIVVVGNSEKGGLYAEDNAVQTGFGMSLSGNDLKPQEGTSLFSNSIPYPQAVVVDGDSIYVASMNSNDVNQNTNGQVGADFPNWTYLNKYGKGFTMSVEKLTLPNLASVWRKTYPVEPESDGSIYSVHVGGLILKNKNTLIVVGSTRAKGPAYGPAEGDDADGYITLLNTDSGDLVNNRKNNIRIGSDTDDVISEVCDVPGDSNSIIVVGATKGDVGGIRDQGAADQIPAESLQWFAKKISLNSLTEVWTIQGGAVGGHDAATSAFAVGCHVTDDVVYVGGTVENGAEMIDGDGRQASMGGNDAFVVQLDLNTGSSNWLRQFGSVGDDQLARNGGITANEDGDAIVYGDTTGAFYRDRQVGSNADIFLAVLTYSNGDFGVRGTPAPGSGPAATVPVSQPTEPPVAPPTQKEDMTPTGESIPDDIVAIQLGPDVGPSYAGGMAYDSEANSLYLTGATYGTFSGPGISPSKRSNCFFARMDLPELEVIQRDTYGVDMVHDSCSAIASNNYNGGRHAIVIGTTQPNGILTELAETEAKEYGFAMDLSLQHKFEFLGGSVVGKDTVTYPVAVVADEENFWTVSMSTPKGKVNEDIDKVKESRFPNFTNGGIHKYGTAFNVVVESFKVFRTGDGNPFSQGAAKNFISEWTQTIAVGNDDEGVFVTGMITVGDSLVVVGSVHTNGNMDGFMARVSRENGKLDMSGVSGKAVEYVTADETSDDWIMGACADPGDSSFFYIVGASQGEASNKGDKNDRKKNRGPVHAVLAKVNAITLRTEWQKQLNVAGDVNVAASAYACDVVSTENIIYVAGTVEDGARMVDAKDAPGVPSRSAGGDDIFVAQISTLDNRLGWMKQVGSNGDDRVARGGGIKVDNSGNAIVFGDTTGDFFRMRDHDDAKNRYSDPFVIMFDKNYGIHQPPLKGPKISSSTTPTEFYNEFTDNQKKGAQIFGIIVLVIVLLVGLYCLYKRCGRRREKKFPTIYDAAAADLGYDDDETTPSSSSRGLGLGLFKDNPAEADGLRVGGPNLNYRDDPEDGGLTGNFHKTYSDLPQSGKEII